MTADPAPSAIMVCGAGHSGSTLLGFLLGGCRGAFYIGEGAKIRYLHDPAKPLRKRACKMCGEDCPVWSRFSWEQTAPLYPQIAALTGARTIVDTTKNPKWIGARAREQASLQARASLILLQRDGRAVVNSRLRKYPERDPETQIQAWVEQMQRSQVLYDAFDGPKLMLRYEELASEPESTARRLCDFAELDYDPAMLRFHEREHHPLGGNNGTQYLAAQGTAKAAGAPVAELNARSRDYYAAHAPEIRLDLRWRTEMKPEHAALFARMAGEFNAPMAWDA
ncbi:MAG: sulfotransferase [Pseudomonadota bacterium]